MYRHILVPLDGSRLAEQVLPHVVALAQKLGARVTLLRATTAARTVGTSAALAGIAPGGGPIVDVTPLIIAEQEAVATYLSAVADRLRAQGVPVDFEYPEGPPAEAILGRAAALGVDLIAMTTHGRGGLGRVVFGSVADEVLRRSTVPVLLIRAQPVETAEDSRGKQEDHAAQQPHP